MGGGHAKRIRDLETQVVRLRGSMFIPRSPRRGVKSYAIYIACDKYKHYPQLKACVQDAKRLEKRIKHRYKTLGTLYDEQVTPTNILQLFNKIKDTEQNARIIIFMAGHGDHMKICDRSFFICHASHQDNLIYTALDLSNINGYCDYFNAEHQLWILDCCFSGFAHRFRGHTLMCSPSIYIMSAGRRGDAVVENDKGGCFTTHLINQWKDNKTITSIFNDVRQQVIKHAAQIPILSKVHAHRRQPAEGEFIV